MLSVRKGPICLRDLAGIHHWTLLHSMLLAVHLQACKHQTSSTTMLIGFNFIRKELY